MSLQLALKLGLGGHRKGGGEPYVPPVELPDMILVYTIPSSSTNIELAIKANSGWFGSGQKVVISWGDDSDAVTVSATSGQYGYIWHTYAAAGTYTVKISGSMTMYGRNDNLDILGQTLLTRVDSFGKLGLTSFRRAFRGCTGLISVPKTLPNNVTRMYQMFYGCSGDMFNPDFSNWDVSKVTDITQIFYNCSGDLFNPNVSNWNVSKVTDMTEMFYNCSGISFNPDVSNWDVSNVTSMANMFRSCSGDLFNPNVSNWNVSKVTDMTDMFRSCSGDMFNPDFSNWDVSNVKNMSRTFESCSGDVFNPDVSNWNVSNVTSMGGMFRYCNGAAFNPNMKSWTLRGNVYTAGMLAGSKTQPTEWLDELLIAWAANSLQGGNITINLSPNKFTEVEGEPLPDVATALQTLTGKGWSITTANPYPAP